MVKKTVDMLVDMTKKIMHWVRYIGNTSGIMIAKQYLEVIDEKLAILSCQGKAIINKV